jgi:hypothetical protein
MGIFAAGAGCLRWILISAVVLSALASPAAAGTLDTPGCKRELADMWASMHEMLRRLRSVARASQEEKCLAYRRHVEVVTQAREVLSRCKTGRERDSDLAQMDGALEDVTGAIERTCAGR